MTAESPTILPRLIIGLGNYSSGYEYTPHNIGFHAVDRLAEKLNGSWREQEEYLSAPLEDRLVLLKPNSYMNVSGAAVHRAGRKWNAAPSAMLLICDDFALPWGRLRFRRSGSAGGHNGLKSVIESLGSLEFPRLRIGVGPVPPGTDPKDFVLKRQPKDLILALAEKASEALIVAAREGVEAAMNRFNAKNDTEDKNK